jgi:hypothetical protein
MTEVAAKAVRKYIFDYFLDMCRAPVLEEIMGRFGLERGQAAKVLEDLEAAHHVVRVPGTNRILMANPFSALVTPFRVRVGERNYFANCAWDAVAFHVMLGADTLVDSFCHHCAEPIQLRFSGGKAVPPSPARTVVYLSIPAASWWDDIVSTCSNNMVFFSSSGHLNDWLEKSPGKRGAALTLDQTLKLSIPLYRTKMSLDYERPTKEESTRYWRSLGLKGEFWRL